MKTPTGSIKLRRTLRRLAPLIGAVLLGILAAGLGWYYLRASEREIAANLEKDADSQRRDVVVARGSLPDGTVVMPNMVAKRSVPVEYVHGDALTPDTFGQFAGRQLMVAVPAGKPLLASFFSAPRKQFAEEIEPGVRAVTIPVDEISSISGMLRAGDRIDFMYVMEKLAVGEKPIIVPLLQDIEVRATGQITAEQFAALRKRPDVSAEVDPYAQQRYSTVTVALPPNDAQKLILAQRMGKIIAALRNAEDREIMRTGVDSSDLDDAVNAFRPQRSRIAPPPPPAPPRAARAEVEYIIGGAGARAGNPMQQAMQALAAMPQADPSQPVVAP